jgi:hypothetical protein
MGFKEARERLIDALLSNQYTHDDRTDPESKNLLASGVVNDDFVVRLLRRCAGWEYSTSRHHFRRADCHIFTPSFGGERWYVKAYWRDEIAVFVSVHP